MNLFRAAPRYAHGEVVTIGSQPVRLRVDGRARRVSVRIAVGGEVVATAPTARMLGEAVAFAGSRSAWIAARLGGRAEARPLVAGQTITVAGKPCRIEAAPGQARVLDEGAGLRLTAPPGERFAPAVVRLLKAEARRAFVERTEVHAAALGRSMPVVGIGDPRSRWGSCTGPRRGFGGEACVGRVRYSWRLILAPFPVLDYVAAHESAHLVEANHGPRFWALVERLAPEWKAQRRWLRAHGESLHAFGQ